MAGSLGQVSENILSEFERKNILAPVRNSNPGQVVCGASILSSDTILTAAHCAVIGDVDKFKVVVGEHDVTKPDGEQSMEPQSWIIHPQYANGQGDARFDNDFAIIKLRTGISFSARVRPVCLPDPSANYDNVQAVATGWGRLWKFATVGGPQPNVLQKVKQVLRILCITLTGVLLGECEDPDQCGVFSRITIRLAAVHDH